MPFHSPRSRRRILALSLLVLTALTSVALHALTRPVSALATEHGHGSHEMSQETMQAWVDDFYATNPRVPAEPAALQGVFVVEFRSAGTTFDADGDFAGTLIDTVVIGVGETVQWRRLVGIHSVTSGTGLADPEVGLLFDVPHDAASPIFQYTFNDPGTFPFFCRPHVDFDMKGVVIVIGATPTKSTTWGDIKMKSRDLQQPR
jgi:plastocyanin